MMPLCFVAMGAIRREMNNPKWTIFAIGYMCIIAYIISLIVFQVGKVFAGGVNVLGLIVVFMILLLVIVLIIRQMILDKKAGKHLCGGSCGSCGGSCTGCSMHGQCHGK